MAEQSGLSFAGLLRQLRAEARLTQEELAEAATVSPRSVSNLERGINRTAHKDTALLLAGALGLTGSAAELFVAAARGKATAEDVLAAAGGGGSQLGAVAGSPYRGLKAFEEQDAGIFFGREAATSQVLNRMSQLVDRPGLLVVSGVSGAGKSSLLRAGMLPQLRAAGLTVAPGAAWWPRMVFTPTRAPLDELALRAGVLAGADAAAVRRELESAPAWFALTTRQAALARPPEPAGDPGGRPAERDLLGQRRLVLVVDQFEELFTLCAEEGQRRAFITALHAAATARHGPAQAPAALVVLGVRADFEARCADYPQLAGPVQDRYLVTAMTERQLRMAITEPAKKAGAKVDDDLADLLLAEVRTGQPGAFGAGALPLLSHALDQAWRHRTGQALTLADYERAGGIDGAVAASAQRVYDRLTPAQQRVARQVFLRLTATSPDGADTADRATRAELTEGRSPAEAQDVAAVLEAFGAERLLTLAAGTVELSHEALLTAWPLLRDTWLADTHADRIVRTRLHATAADWEGHARDPSYLYAGSLLQSATDTGARAAADPGRHLLLSQTETDFLDASNRAHRRRARIRRAVIAGLLVLTVTAVITAGIAVRNAANAARQHAIALSRQLAAESITNALIDQVTARRLAAAAWQVFHTDQAISAMTTLLGEQQQNGILLADPVSLSGGGVNGVSFSPDGKLLAGVTGAGSVRLWNPATGQPLRVLRATGTGPQNGLNGVAFSPDGKLLASADADGTVRLWDRATGQRIRVLHAAEPGVYRGVTGVAFSPNGKLLASAANDLTIRLWDPATGQMRRVLHISSTGGNYLLTGVAFSPDGKLLATADGDGTVRLWKPTTGQQIRVLHAPVTALPGPAVLGVAFSPNGRLLATADGDGTVRLWDPATGQQVRVLHTVGGTTAVNAVAFSPTGGLLASADEDGTVRLWHPATGQALSVALHISVPVPGLTHSGFTGVAFSPDGRLLASGASDGTVRLLDLATGQPVGASPSSAATGPIGTVNQVAFSANGKLLATGDADATMRLWDLTTGKPPQVLHTPNSAVSNRGVTGVIGVAFSPDSTLLASAGGDGAVRLWNPATGQQVRVLHATSARFGVNAVAFSPDGRLLASAGGDGTVRLWNPATGQQVRVLHATNARFGVNAVAFSPHGTLLASAGGDGAVRLWNPATGQQVRVLHATSARFGVNAVAFSPHGKLLADGEGDGTIRLWNPATGRAIRILHAIGSGTYLPLSGVAFSPNGKLLASVVAAVRLWDPATGQALGVPFGPGNPPIEVDTVAFSPNGRLLASADIAGAVRFWKVSAFTNPYAALCAEVGAPTRQEWKQYASGTPQPSICS